MSRVSNDSKIGAARTTDDVGSKFPPTQSKRSSGGATSLSAQRQAKIDYLRRSVEDTLSGKRGSGTVSSDSSAEHTGNGHRYFNLGRHKAVKQRDARRDPFGTEYDVVQESIAQLKETIRIAQEVIATNPDLALEIALDLRHGNRYDNYTLASALNKNGREQSFRAGEAFAEAAEALDFEKLCGTKEYLDTFVSSMYRSIETCAEFLKGAGLSGNMLDNTIKVDTRLRETVNGLMANFTTNKDILMSQVEDICKRFSGKIDLSAVTDENTVGVDTYRRLYSALETPMEHCERSYDHVNEATSRHLSRHASSLERGEKPPIHVTLRAHHGGTTRALEEVESGKGYTKNKGPRMGFAEVTASVNLVEKSKDGSKVYNWKKDRASACRDMDKFQLYMSAGQQDKAKEVLGKHFNMSEQSEPVTESSSGETAATTPSRPTPQSSSTRLYDKGATTKETSSLSKAMTELSQRYLRSLNPPGNTTPLGVSSEMSRAIAAAA